MIIAVPYQDGAVFQHFGHTRQFKIFHVEDNRVTESQLADPAGAGHGALAGFLKEQGVDTLICGGIGAGAKQALAQAGIRLFGGVFGDADAAVDALLAGTLRFNPDIACQHHEHGEGHSCSGHTDCAQGGCHHGC